MLCTSALHAPCSVATFSTNIWSVVKANHPQDTGLCSERSQSQAFAQVRHDCMARPDLEHHQVLTRIFDTCSSSSQSRNAYLSSETSSLHWKSKLRNVWGLKKHISTLWRCLNSPAASRAGEVSTWRRWLVCHCSLTCCSSSFSSCSCFSFSRASQNLALLLLLLGSPLAGLPSPCGLRSGQSVSSTASSSSPTVEGIYTVWHCVCEHCATVVVRTAGTAAWKLDHLQMAKLHAEDCAMQHHSRQITC